MARKRKPRKRTPAADLGTIKPVQLGSFSQEAMRAYGSYVLMDRAVADVRDGLKPVQRRILWAMHELKLTKGFKKSAKVVGDVMGNYHPHGDCLSGDTLVYSLDNEFHTFRDLAESGRDVWTLAYDEKTDTLVPAVAHSFRVGQVVTRMYRVHLSDGHTIVCTGNHPFYTRGGCWVRAKDLVPNTSLKSGFLYGENNRRFRFAIAPGDTSSFDSDSLLGVVKELSPGYLTFVVSVEEADTDPVEMYDFTVDDYENMIIPLNDGQDVSFVVAHNSAIYQTMVNMVWDRYPLVEGHGNFGSPTDNAASMRYTECRLSPLATALFEDIGVATMVPNYSDDRKEPLVIPSRVPLLLLNGSSGIGVGLRATIPPHNLRELVRCLVYFIKKDNPRISTIVKNMPGPDYGNGIMLSSPEDVRSLYETGKGTLRFRCTYHYEEGPLLVVTGLAPGFNMSSFLTKMRKLSEEGLIEFCSDASSANGTKIYVSFKDAAVLKDRILPELHTSQSYQFYVVKRDGDVTLSEDKLFSGGLFRMFEEFVSFRREVEEARLRSELLSSEEDLLRAGAIYLAIKKISVVYKVLQEKHDTLKSMAESLSNGLSITVRQAFWILDMKVHRLARMNEDSQEAKITGIRATVVEIKADLSDIEGVIVRHLKNLLPYSDSRKTLLSSDVDTPVLDVDTSSSWVISQGSKISRLSDDPSRRHKFDFIAESASIVTAVYSDNSAEVLSTSYLTEKQVNHSIVGLVSDADDLLVALDDTGKVVVITHPPGKRTSFNVIRKATRLVSAVGVRPGGYLALATSAGKGRVVPYEDLKGTRPFVAGFKLYPTADHGSRGLVVTSLLGLPPGSEVYNAKGKCLTCKDEEYFDTRSSLIPIGSRNFVSVNTGKRDILDGAATVVLLRRGELDRCWILT